MISDIKVVFNEFSFYFVLAFNSFILMLNLMQHSINSSFPLNDGDCDKKQAVLH